jgi:hypothetical protein
MNEEENNLKDADILLVMKGLCHPKAFTKRNETCNFEGGYFSYLSAENVLDFGISEIACVFNRSFYILQAEIDVFEQCKEKCKESTNEILKWWISLSEKYPIGPTSNDFEEWEAELHGTLG